MNSNYYPNDEQQIKNDKLGYKHHDFGKLKTDTWSELVAKEIVLQYRKNGNYSRIVCYHNNVIGLKTFSVIYRKK